MSKTELFNLATSLAVVACGIVIDFFLRPKAFKEHPFARFSFQLWVLRWLSLSFGWLLFVAHVQDSHFSRWTVLLIVDAGSMLTQGFCWSMLLGDSLCEKEELRAKIFFGLIFGFIILTLWNVLLSHSDRLISSLGISVWTAPSLMVATLNSLMIGFVLASRSKVRLISVLIFIIQLSYAIWEVPAYTELFGPRLDDPNYSNTLATLKVLSGAVSYLIFVHPDTNFGTINSGPSDWLGRFKTKIRTIFDPQLSPRLSSFLINILAGLVVAAVVSVTVAIYSPLQRHLLKSPPKDDEQVRDWSGKAVLGDPLGQYNLGHLYASGAGALPKDEGQAIYWLRKAAAQGDARAKSELDAICQTDANQECSQRMSVTPAADERLPTSHSH